MKLFCLPALFMIFFIAGYSQNATLPVPKNDLYHRPVIVPVPSFTSGVKQPVISLEGLWKITIEPPAFFWKKNTNIASWKDIHAPAQADMQGIRIQRGKEYAYKKKIFIPKDFSGKRIMLRFNGVSGTARAWINGSFLKEHFGGFNIWTCDITDFVSPGKEAWLTLGVTDPLAEKAIAGFDQGGILRDIELMAVAPDYLYRFNIETDLDEEYRNAEMKVWVGMDFNKNENAHIQFKLKDPAGKELVINPSGYDLSKNDAEVIIKIPVNNPVKWDAEHPELYTLEAIIMDGASIAQTVTKKIGFREIKIEGAKMLVNGKEVKLRGAGRFDSDPVYGRYLSDEQCRKEVKMLKDANLNFVRPSCYPASEAYLDACDKTGLYVQLENTVTFTRGAQNDTSLSKNFLSMMAEMIEATRTHPSVIIYELANETYYGINIGKTYRYAKAEDPSRPVIYSWSHTVPPGVPWPYDIFSYHYSDWDADLGKPGVAVFNSRPVRPLPTGIPVLHDEFAHGSAYYHEQLARDPGMRDFWGESIKRFWETMFTTEGCLGGAMWAIIDENAGGSWVYEWGAIDLWRRERPEYWHFKKAYSPIRIDDANYKNPGQGKPLIIPVKNWYDHTNFNELAIHWSIKEDSGQIKGPDIKPHGIGYIEIPPHSWNDNDSLNLRFYDGYNRLVDEFNIVISASAYTLPEPQGPIPALTEDSALISVTGKNFTIIFSKKDGLIKSGIYKGKKIIKGGPYFHLTGGNIGKWTLKKLTAMPADKHEVVVTINGAYDSVDVIFDIHIDGTGLVTTEYTLGRFAVSVPRPRKIPWDDQDAGGFEEVGISYLVADDIDQLTWKRKGLWSVYPADHIGRNEGTANRYGHNNEQIFGKKPEGKWSQDEKEFSVFGQYDIGGRGTNDFRSTKENVTYASAIASDKKIAVRVESGGKDAVRMQVIEDKSGWVDNDNIDITYGGSWKPASDTFGYYGSTETHSTKAGDYVEYTFTGTGIAWIGSKERSFGMADVYIDNKLEATGINFFSRGGPVKQAVLFSKEGLLQGSHTIKIIAKQANQLQAQQGQGNNNERRMISIPVDAFQVLNGMIKGSVDLIINNLWNQTRMGLGNYMKEPILIGSQYRNHVTFRLMDAQ